MPSIDRKKATHNRTALCAGDRLRLAATPTFAAMTLLTGIFGGAQTPMICSATQGASLLTGMAPMYLLMSVFHVAPWLSRIADRQNIFPKNLAR